MTQTHQNPSLPIEELRQRLLGDEQRLRHELYELTSGDEAVSTSDPILETGWVVSDQVDEAGTLFEYERNRALITHTQHMLKQVHDALARMDAGTYGQCTNCGRAIAPARLRALPYVSLCIDCQAKSEISATQGGQPRV
jgi:RNA polymerase-binding transcription factor DksA